MKANLDLKNANKALNVAIFSVIGALIPILGLILASISLIIAAGVKDKKAVAAAKTVAIIGIFLSLAAGFVYGLWAYDSYEKNKQIEFNKKIQAEIKKEGELKASREAYIKETELKNCLTQVEQWYSKNATGYRSYEYLQLLLQRRQQLVSDCQIKFPTK
jgi:hypothetical protein